MKLFTIIILIIVSCACAAQSDFPKAFLIINNHKYEMNVGESCWNNDCDDYSVFTARKPLVIEKTSELTLFFSYKEAPSCVTMETLEPSRYKKTIEPHSGDIFWRPKELSKEELKLKENREPQELSATATQSIPNNFELGEIILSVYSCWSKHNDATFNIYLKVKP